MVIQRLTAIKHAIRNAGARVYAVGLDLAHHGFGNTFEALQGAALLADLAKAGTGRYFRMRSDVPRTAREIAVAVRADP